MKMLPIRVQALVILAIWGYVSVAAAQVPEGTDLMAAYKTLHAFTLDGGSARVSNLILKRDRAEMTFTGTFYFTRPVLGKVTGAVFVGEGKFRARTPIKRF